MSIFIKLCTDIFLKFLADEKKAEIIFKYIYSKFQKEIDLILIKHLKTGELKKIENSKVSNAYYDYLLRLYRSLRS
jgi:hypothetical protein